MRPKTTGLMLCLVLAVISVGLGQLASNSTSTLNPGLLLLAPTIPPSPYATPPGDFVYYGITRGKVRQNLLYYGYTLTVLEARQATTLTDSINARPEFRLISLYVRLASSDEEGATISPTSLYVQDSKGQKYTALPYGLSPGFFDQPTYLADGDKIQGWLTFEIPQSAEGLVFCQELPLDSVLFTVELADIFGS